MSSRKRLIDEPNATFFIHISDIHIKDNNAHYRQKLWNFWSWIVTRYKNEDPKPTIFITGDIVDGSKLLLMTDDILELYENEMNLAYVMLAEVRKHDFPIVICPGNHDMPPGGNGSNQSFRNVSDAFIEQNQYMEVGKPRGVFEFNRETVPTYPTLIRLPNTGDLSTFALVLDSNQEPPGQSFGSDGQLGNSQIKKMEKMLKTNVPDDSLVFILLHHHPIEPLPLHTLKDATQFFDVLREMNLQASNKKVVVLFGHNHTGPYVYREFAQDFGMEMFICSTSSTARNMSGWLKDAPFSLLEIHVDLDGGDVRVKRVFTKDKEQENYLGGSETLMNNYKSVDGERWIDKDSSTNWCTCLPKKGWNFLFTGFSLS